MLFAYYSCLPPTYSKKVIKNSDQKNNIPIPVTTRTALSITADAKKNEKGNPNVTNTIAAKTIYPKKDFIIAPLLCKRI